MTLGKFPTLSMPGFLMGKLEVIILIPVSQGYCGDVSAFPKLGRNSL